MCKGEGFYDAMELAELERQLGEIRIREAEEEAEKELEDMFVDPFVDELRENPYLVDVDPGDENDHGRWEDEGGAV